VRVMGAGLRPIGKLMDKPPYPTMRRALHFYPNRLWRDFDSGVERLELAESAT
jgi:hypothetical protein